MSREECIEAVKLAFDCVRTDRCASDAERAEVEAELAAVLELL